MGRKILNPLSLWIQLLSIVIVCAALMLAFRVYNISVLFGGGDPFFGFSEVQKEFPSISDITILEKGIPSKRLRLTASPGGREVLDSHNLTAEEIHFLENLPERRWEMEYKEGSPEERQQILLAIEKRINSKVEEYLVLQAIRKELIMNYGNSTTAKFHSFIKVFENMKPKEAAVLLSKIEQGAMVDMLGQMNASRAAAILGHMDPQVVPAVTEDLDRH